MKTYQIATTQIKATFLAKGATITRLQVNLDGQWRDVLLSYENIDTFIEADPYFLNCVVGPHAGRIKNGRYFNGEDIIELDRNENGNHHHGGKQSFRNLDFEVRCDVGKIVFSAYDEVWGIELNIKVEVHDETLMITYHAVPKLPQVINMTHHLYFNLSDEKTITNHMLETQAPYVHELDETCAPTATLIPVENTPFDFRVKKKLGDNMRLNHPQFDITRNIDHPFYTKGIPVFLESHLLGVKIESTSDYTVMYTSNFFDGAVSFLNRGLSVPFEGIAIESQDLPNGVNIPHTKDQIYTSDRPYMQSMTYGFYKVSS